jgi:hypothetical protein
MGKGVKYIRLHVRTLSLELLSKPFYENTLNFN